MTGQIHTITLGNLNAVILRHTEPWGFRYSARLTAERQASIRLKTLAETWIAQQMVRDSAERKQSNKGE